jgi:hypothetical protein
LAMHAALGAMRRYLSTRSSETLLWLHNAWSAVFPSSSTESAEATDAVRRPWAEARARKGGDGAATQEGVSDRRRPLLQQLRQRALASTHRRAWRRLHARSRRASAARCAARCPRHRKRAACAQRSR